MTNPETDVTGRDSYIVHKALAYAIATIQNLPKQRQEYSDMLDMCALLKANPAACIFILEAQNHMGVPINLDPEQELENAAS